MIGRPASPEHDAEGGGQGHGRCAVDGCASAPCGRVTVRLGGMADCRATLDLCRWHGIILDEVGLGDERLVAEFRCPQCGGPVRAEQHMMDGALARFYACARRCTSGYGHEDPLFDAALERLEAAYKAGDL